MRLGVYASRAAGDDGEAAVGKLGGEASGEREAVGAGAAGANDGDAEFVFADEGASDDQDGRGVRQGLQVCGVVGIGEGNGSSAGSLQKDDFFGEILIANLAKAFELLGRKIRERLTPRGL
ncbi:hypothetical protein CCAX7_46120 [Capsulimonas corticalis]|uniref:Uncharacterized protein n=1 Tax=Capsulimonas corticalis TaxID=2219043 RepID=A0A402D553_9BACT|nr:hypothetical protein [Capsulimonas corticalis]BDI32561.1 hypothetical protein CCAX7_46120 [Capsulimonas corticalis]